MWVDQDIWERDKVKYQEARNQERHLSYITYIALGFFISITGFFLMIPTKGLNLNLNGVDVLVNPIQVSPYLSLSIGYIFLSLLIILAKLSRTASDNSNMIEEFKRNYPSKIEFEQSSIRGIGNFLQFFILNGLTVYLLLYHRQSPLILKDYIIILLLLFMATYYILGGGRFPTFIINPISNYFDKRIKKEYRIVTQWVVYLLIFGCSLYYYINYGPK